MNKKIHELLKSYEGKELDDNFINEAYKLMIQNLDVNDYISDFSIDNNSMQLGSYSNMDKRIKINKDHIMECNHVVGNKKLLSLEVIRHELEHARQLKKLHNWQKDIESAIIDYSLKPYSLIQGLEIPYDQIEYEPNFLDIKKKQNYTIDPGERLAEINAWKYIISLIKNQNHTDDLLQSRTMLYHSYIRGYKDNGYYLDPPTYEFLLKLGLYRDLYLLKQRLDKTKYCFDTRITYGLPITYDEYNTETLKKAKLKKKTI